MAEDNQQPRRRIPWSYIFSFLVVIGILVTVLILLFGGNRATSFAPQDFVNNLGNDRIRSVTETAKERDVVIVSGTYTPKGASANTLRKYKVTFNYTTYYEQSNDWTFKRESDNTLVPLYDANDDGIADEITLANYIVKKSQIASASDPVTFVLNSADDPYQVSWWDQWGPTIIMLAGSLLIFLLIFGRLFPISLLFIGADLSPEYLKFIFISLS